MSDEPIEVTIVRGPNVHPAPRVSVVIPAYQSKWLDEALESVRAQTLVEREIIVVDDGSPGPIAPARSDDVVLVRHPNAGPGGARNRGFEVARAELIALLDSDDRWRPEKLERQAALHARRPDLVMSCTDCCIMGAAAKPGDRISERSANDGEVIRLAALFYENPLCCSSVMMQRHALERTPGMAPNRRMGEDYGLWLRMGLLGPIGYLPEVLIERRVHSDGLMFQTLRDMSWLDEERRVYEEVLADHPELRARPYVRAALARVAFQGGYIHLTRGEWALARRALVRSLLDEPRRPKTWIDLGRALLHVRPRERVGYAASP